jgi:lysophospholipase L1-like esterase
LSGITAIILIIHYKINNGLKNIVFSVAIIGILFAALVLIDRVIGIIFFQKETNQALINEGLIFEPNSKARYKTDEFDYNAEINNLGLRDIEINIDKKNKFRILCFGDSFTFGWGVKAENSWPKKLEKFLKMKGYKYIEVINCGRGDQYTSGYRKYIEKVVPFLKPDLVLVGVTQGDDLAQIYENDFLLKTRKISIYSIFNRVIASFLNFLNKSFHNILIISKYNSNKELDIASNWKNSSLNMIYNFDNHQKLIYDSIYYSVKERFESGNLNAGLLHVYVDLPEMFLIFNDPLNTKTLYSINEMKKDVTGMKMICSKNNSKLIFINLPISDFTGHNVIRTPTMDVINKYLYKNNNIDSIYKSVALFSNIPYYELTDRFKKLTDKSAYYYKYDGHPNEKGYEEIANGIGEYLNMENTLQIIKNKE